jgi:hypothetical protein
MADPILSVIARLSFRFAKTLPHIPHEYTVRTPETEADYVALFEAILTQGVREWFEPPGRRRYRVRYLHPGDGWKYWAMTTALGASHVINRARVAP